MVFDEALLNYGMAGIFILYLIYDRQILLTKLTSAINDLTEHLKGKKEP